MARIPVSTYRLQIHKEFGLADAQEIIGYLAKLGIGDMYASPLLTARAGSQHGYDVTDPRQINPETGGESAFAGLVAELHRHQMGLLLDIVPNHMAASLENPLWRDVLKHGQESEYGHVFDIDWNSSTPGLAGKVLLPVLGGPFRDVLESGELTLDHDGNEFGIRYYENVFPIAPGSLELIPQRDDPQAAITAVNGSAGDPDSFALLERIIRAQHYRLAFWRVAAHTINYRRFFDVSELVSLRADDRSVFDLTHAHLVELAERGDITGVRIDHIDGLRDPAGYLEWVQEAFPDQGDGFYVTVEKILASGEDLPADWLTAGTSGYDFLNMLNGVFVERRSIAELDRTYASLRGSEPDFEELVYERKQQVMRELFPGDIRALALELWSIAAGMRAGIDLSLDEVERALVEVIAHFQVYRTYTHSQQVTDADRRYIQSAVAAALARKPELERALSVFQDVVLLRHTGIEDEAERERWLAFVMRWQQFTGPIMAKGFEDTSLYVYNRLISLNEVGGEPDPAGVPLADLHAWAEHRQQRWNGAISTTSTHDTKRSEDVRARINVLSELTAEWDAALRRWQALNRDKKTEVNGTLAPDGNEDHLIYHSMLGAWPFDTSEVPEFRERLKQYLLKASREAKTHTSWIGQDEEYEAALTGFVDRVIVDDAGDAFMQDFLALQSTLALQGALNSLSQTLLKICLPGVPDFYQGTELWDLSMVDPDNRRPVDYTLRSNLLQELQGSDPQGLVDGLLRNWRNGKVKLYLTWKALSFRKREPDLFRIGEYLPLYGSGEYGRHVAAFARHRQERWLIVAAPRLTVTLARARGRSFDELPLGDAFWGNITIPVPDGAPERWRDELTGQIFQVDTAGEGRVLRIATLFGRFPGALLVGEPG